MSDLVVPTQIFIYVIVPILIGVISFSINSLLKRISSLEQTMINTTTRMQTEAQVRQLITDRYDPISEDIREIKDKMDKMLDIYLKVLEKNTKN